VNAATILTVRRVVAKLSLLAALFICGSAHAQNTASVEGVVVDGRTGLPLQGVSVYFGSVTGPHYEAETDATGGFRIVGIAYGDYGCHFEKSGYITQYSGSQNSSVKAVHISGQAPVRISVSLFAYSKLSGRVLDPEGRPASYAKVSLAPMDETTDEQGRFAFSQITPGSYMLKATPGKGDLIATPAGLKRTPATPQPEAPPGEDRKGLLTTWYPGATRADLAEAVVVRGGEDLAGIEIHLQSSVMYRVRGKAFLLDGSLVQTGRVTTFSRENLGITVSGGIIGGKPGQGDLLGYFMLDRSALPAPADEMVGYIRDGSFEITSVPGGLRRFRVTPMTGDIAKELEQLKKQLEQLKETRQQGLPPPLPRPTPPVQVLEISVIVDHDIDDLEVRAQPAFGLDATVELSNTPADQTPTAVRNAVVSIDGVERLTPRGKRTVNSFHFDNVEPGEILVSAPPGLSGGYYLASVSMGGQDITWKPVSMNAGAPPIVVTYKQNGGTITGTVESGDARSVVLIPQAPLDAVDVQYGRTTSLRPGGAFEIGSLAPGSYYAFAVDRLEPERLLNPTMAGRIAAAAALVRVAEGATISIKPPLVHLGN
jgi:hypothetical protein